MEENKYNSISKYLSGNMELDELEVFMAELDRSEELQKEVAIAAKLYNDESAQQLEELRDQIQPKVISINRYTTKHWLSIAAAIVVLVSLSIWQLFMDKEEVLIFAANNLPSEHVLPDGSTITLNKNSKLTYLINDDELRVAALEGEAFFEIKRDESRPFLVNTSAAQVSVLGTSFLVNTTDQSETVVSVETGKVSFASKQNEDEKVYLTPGEEGKLNRNSNKISKSISLAVKHLYWKDRTLIFRKTRLERVIKTLSEVYEADIKLKNEDLQDCKISVAFEDETLENILEIIGVTFNLKIEQQEAQYTIDGKGC